VELELLARQLSFDPWMDQETIRAMLEVNHCTGGTRYVEFAGKSLARCMTNLDDDSGLRRGVWHGSAIREP
jgi:hypothetical protein